MTDVLERRSSDIRIAALEAAQARMEAKLDENNRVTAESAVTLGQVRDILATFKTVGTVAKWLTVIASSITAFIALAKSWRFHA